jgi:hypothetical protein
LRLTGLLKKLAASAVIGNLALKLLILDWAICSLFSLAFPIFAALAHLAFILL